MTSRQNQEEISFDRWCEIAASTSGRPREVLLDRLDAEDISEEAWSEANVTHLLAIAGGLKNGDCRLADKYAQRCMEAREPLKASEALDASLSAHDSGPRSLPFAKTGGAAARPAPSDLQEQSGETTALPTHVPIGAPLPFDKPGDVVTPPVFAPTPPASDAGQTQAIDVSRFSRRRR